MTDAIDDIQGELYLADILLIPGNVQNLCLVLMKLTIVAVVVNFP